MTTEKTVDKGRLVDNAITQKDFISKADASKFGVLNPEGTVKWLGTIIGKTLGGKEKITVQPDGTPLRSFQFEGLFEAYIYDTDETKTARSVFLPKAIASELELTLKEVQNAAGEGDETAVGFSIELGVEATGRNIPFGYKVRAFGQQKVDILADLRASLPIRGAPRLAIETQTPAPAEPEDVKIGDMFTADEQAAQSEAEVAKEEMNARHGKKARA